MHFTHVTLRARSALELAVKLGGPVLGARSALELGVELGGRVPGARLSPELAVDLGGSLFRIVPRKPHSSQHIPKK